MSISTLHKGDDDDDDDNNNNNNTSAPAKLIAVNLIRPSQFTACSISLFPASLHFLLTCVLLQYLQIILGCRIYVV